MTIQRKKEIVALAIGLIVVVLLLGWQLFRNRILLEQRLPDGSILTLAGWSYGKRHVLYDNSKDSSNGTPTEITRRADTEQDTLVLWIHRKGKTGVSDLELEVIDDKGYQMAVTNERDLTHPMDSAYTPITLSIFPRQGKTLNLRFYMLRSERIVAEYTIPNPVRKSANEWSTIPLPTKKQIGTVGVTLQSIEPDSMRVYVDEQDGSTNRTNTPLPTQRLLLGEANRIITSFEVQDTKDSKVIWEPSVDKVELHTGQALPLRHLSPRLLNPLGTQQSWLMPDIGEPLRLHVRLSQKVVDPEKAEFRWKPGLLGVNNHRSLVHHEVKTSIDGMDFEMECNRIIALQPNRTGLPAFANPNPRIIILPQGGVRVYVSPITKGATLAIRGKDDKGSPIDAVYKKDRLGNGWISENSRVHRIWSAELEVHTFIFTLPLDVTKVDIECAIIPCKYTDFIVMPPKAKK